MAWTFTTLKSAIQDYTDNTEASFVSNMTNIIVQAENSFLTLERIKQEHLQVETLIWQRQQIICILIH